MKKIKILRIIARLNIGGPAIHTILLTARFNNEKYCSKLVKGVEGYREGDMQSFAIENGVEPIVIPELQREINVIKDSVALWKLYRLMRREKPDIVHTHTAKAGMLGRTAAWLAGVPVILHTFHGHILRGYFGRTKTLIFLQIEKIMAMLSTKIITISESLKKELVELGVAPEDKIEVIPIGLDLAQFVKHNNRGEFKRSLGLSKDCLIVGTVGRLVPIKGQRYFLEAANKICGDMNGNGDVKFVIVGDGELRDELEARARELGLEGKVYFTGFRTDLTDIYADFDIMVLPSLNEGTPVALIEAMSSGKPVVATTVGGIIDLVEDGVTGLLVESESERELREGILALLSDKAKRTMLGRKGREAVYPAYDIETLVARMSDVYASSLS
jgi:glycosyltransferase involved in cell wall biosynthesis